VDSVSGGSGGTVGNVQQNNTLTVLGDGVSWGNNGLRSANTYDRSGGDLTIEVDVKSIDCSVGQSIAGISYGSINILANPGDTYAVTQYNGKVTLWYFHNGSVSQSQITSFVCTNNTNYHVKLVILQAGGANLYINGSSSPDATVSQGTFTDKNVNLHNFSSTATVTYTNFSLSDVDAAAPTISTLSPADNATSVALNSNLVVTFSEAVDAGSGNINLYKTTGDVLVEAFDVTTNITGSGTNTISINPTSNLLGETNYYVKIDTTAFDDMAGNSFAGIADTTTWNFTSASTKPQVIFDGDSITYGVGSTGGLNYPNQTITLLGGSSAYDGTNLGVPSETIATMIANDPTVVDPLYSAYRTNNFVLIWGGTNDLYFGADNTTVYNYIVSYAEARRLAGFKVAVFTILPRSAGSPPANFESYRQSINSMLRANWAAFADALIDVATDSRIGDAGDELDTTYYADKVHYN